MKVDLTRDQIDGLQKIVGQAQIPGNAAQFIVSLQQALNEAISKDNISTTVEGDVKVKSK